jgi:hypothetical protein
MEKLGDYQLDKSAGRSQRRNGFEFEQSDVIQFFNYVYRVSIYHRFDISFFVNQNNFNNSFFTKHFIERITDV